MSTAEELRLPLLSTNILPALISDKVFGNNNKQFYLPSLSLSCLRFFFRVANFLPII